jgi:voltage-gated potassium channel
MVVAMSQDTRGPTPRRLIVGALSKAAASTLVLLVVYYLLPLDRSAGGALVAWLGAGLVAFMAVAALQIRAILRAPYPALRAVTGFGIAIPLFLLVFASTYLSIAAGDRQAFSEALSHTDALYFTVTVFSTVGFGDITPSSQSARIATTLQMVGGLLVLGLLARVVVSAVQESRERQREARRERTDEG